ncbi:hypothetical protein KR222_000995, partial [Zaprionus bogoriensis]
ALIATAETADYRLSQNVVPSFYNLTIGIRGDAEHPGTIFDGEVKITLQATEAGVAQITLHKDSLEIVECWLESDSDELVESMDIARLNYVQETQQLTVPLAQDLIINQNYSLHFRYTGTVRTDVSGLFSTSYADEVTGQTKWLLLTELQSINARLVFPCFDEPAMKAKFQLHIGRAAGFQAISNTKLISTTDEGGNRFVDHFAVTPPMSTYLLAFVISEYKARGDTNELAMYTRSEYYNYTEFSYSVAQRVLPAYDELFQLPYKQLGNELFQYATTPRFPHNSMENWGLVIFKDKVLLEQEGYTDGWTQKEFTIRNIIHENSHMWFGNSVTFKWWSYVWMHEGFARFYEFFMGHQLYPEYQLDQQFVVQKLQHILSTDALNLTQPMTSPEESIQTPADIDYKFGRIAFAKASSIIRMWRNAMGVENFDAAIRSYLKQHHLGNTEPQDLFAHLKQHWPVEQVVSLDQFFADYTEQPGYPLIMVNISLENKLIRLQQKRFLLNPGDGSDAELRYTVPITFATNLEPNFQNLTPRFYLDKIADTAEWYFNQPIDWIVLNLQQSNYYRVLYDTPILRKIQQALARGGHSSVAVENRAQLVDDLFSFAHVGIVDYSDVFEFLEYLSREVDYIPWFSVYAGLQDVAQRLTPQQLPDFEKFLKDITAAVYDKLGVGWSSDDSVLDVYNRNLQVSWLCKHRHARCNSEAQSLFEASQQKPSPDYRETFYCAAARSSGYARVLFSYQQESNSNERELLWRAASCTRDYRTHYQNEILGGSSSIALKTIGLAQLYVQNPDLITPIFQMVTENITQLAEALDSWPRAAQALSDMADYFSARDQLELFEKFYTENHALFGSSEEVLQSALSTAEANIQWAEQRLDRLVLYLIVRSGAAATGLTLSLLLLLLLPLMGLLAA